jgi:mercuric reductase
LLFPDKEKLISNYYSQDKIMEEITQNNQATVSLCIEGMTCDRCAVSIEKRFAGKKGIISKQVSYGKKSGEFTYVPSLISKQEIVDTINSTKRYRVVSNNTENTINATKPYRMVSNNTENGSGKNHFDLIIIGGGSAAFSAAIKAEELGLSTLMVNAGLPFGGTCVNVGCVPSKTLIRSAEAVYHSTHSNFEGVRPKGADVDFARVIKDKKQLVATLQQKKYVDVVGDFENLQMIEGWAEFVDNKTILVNGNDTYTALKFIITTGASTNIPEIEGLKAVGYLTNATLFDLEEKPESLTIMGAGYIGLEIAMAYNRLGVKVRIIEFTDRVLRTQTPDISEELEKQMKSEEIEILPNFRAVKIRRQYGYPLQMP